MSLRSMLPRLTAGTALLALACLVPFPQFAFAQEDTPSEVESLLAADRKWAAAAKAGNVEQILSSWADDAVNYFPGEPPAVGKEVIRRLVLNNRSLPGFSLTWQTEGASVARASDIGFTHGSFQMTMSGPDAAPIVKHGYYVCIWERQEDDVWKCILEISNFGEERPATSD